MQVETARTYEVLGHRYCRACDHHVGEGSFFLLLRVLGFFVASWVLPYVLIGALLGLSLCLINGVMFNPVSLAAGVLLFWGSRKLIGLLLQGLSGPLSEGWHFCEADDRLLRLPRRWPFFMLGLLLPVAAAFMAIVSAGLWEQCWRVSHTGVADWLLGLLGPLIALGLSILYTAKSVQVLRGR